MEMHPPSVYPTDLLALLDEIAPFLTIPVCNIIVSYVIGFAKDQPRLFQIPTTIPGITDNDINSPRLQCVYGDSRQNQIHLFYTCPSFNRFWVSSIDVSVQQSNVNVNILHPMQEFHLDTNFASIFFTMPKLRISFMHLPRVLVTTAESTDSNVMWMSTSSRSPIAHDGQYFHLNITNLPAIGSSVILGKMDNKRLGIIHLPHNKTGFRPWTPASYRSDRTVKDIVRIEATCESSDIFYILYPDGELHRVIVMKDLTVSKVFSISGCFAEYIAKSITKSNLDVIWKYRNDVRLEMENIEKKKTERAKWSCQQIQPWTEDSIIMIHLNEVTKREQLEKYMFLTNNPYPDDSYFLSSDSYSPGSLLRVWSIPIYPFDLDALGSLSASTIMFFPYQSKIVFWSPRDRSILAFFTVA